MLRNLCRGAAGAILAVSIAGCGGGEGTTMPSTPQTLSPELQDLKAQIVKKQNEKLAHHGRSRAYRARTITHR